jgi:hypothetical protein
VRGEELHAMTIRGSTQASHKAEERGFARRDKTPFSASEGLGKIGYAIDHAMASSKDLRLYAEYERISDIAIRKE